MEYLLNELSLHSDKLSELIKQEDSHSRSPFDICKSMANNKPESIESKCALVLNKYLENYKYKF